MTNFDINEFKESLVTKLCKIAEKENSTLTEAEVTSFVHRMVKRSIEKGMRRKMTMVEQCYDDASNLLACDNRKIICIITIDVGCNNISDIMEGSIKNANNKS